MKILITGGLGFLGTNLTAHAIERGYQVLLIDNYSRTGTKENEAWLQTQGNFSLLEADVRDFDVLANSIKEFQPDVVFHVAGQVAMVTSIDKPRYDFEVNVLGTLNVLEALRLHCPTAALFFSSTNKVYGDLESIEYFEDTTRYCTPGFPQGIPESMPLSFCTPYGCSKGAADQYVLDYHRVYGLKTVVFRHSSIYGSHQFSTIDQGWIGWFLHCALERVQGQEEPFTICGNGKQVRDVLHSSDLVTCYFQAVEKIDSIAGEVFNVGGGVENSLSLLELFFMLESMLETQLRFKRLPVRASDQKCFIADIRKAQDYFGWKPQMSAESGIVQMIEWLDSIERVT